MGSSESQFGRLNTVDDLIRRLTEEELEGENVSSAPRLAFPTSAHVESNDKYEFFRAADLDRLAEGVAATYLQNKLQPVVSHNCS